MKKLLISLLTLFIVAISQGQTQQSGQTGLLWKISGNNIKKPSYIYGNMHVSSKIAFRLGEEFFEALENVDKVALESNPIIWLEEIMNSQLADKYIGDFEVSNQRNKGFYKNQFKLYIPDNKDYSTTISSEHYFMNWLLYRENKGNSDFEEETFLDMFIYQAGAKNKKEILSLENFKENTEYVQNSMLPDLEEKVPSHWFVKMTTEKSYGELLEEAYRKQDLSLIDSLQKEVTGENGLYWMIYLRNEKMAHQIDSIIKSGTSLFSGVGAAHLPGEKGILKLLEAMGYKVEAMPVTFSDKARATREAYDKKKIPLSNYQNYESDLFSVSTPVNLYETPYSETQRQWFGPELTNGSYITIKQLSTLRFFRDLTQAQILAKVDSLLFENIPGKIESKTPITGTFYQGFDIINKTKAGDYQRFKIFITPMNFFIFKMGGKDDFVIKEGEKFFNSIKLNPPTTEWKEATTIHNDFKISIPNYYSITYNTKISSLYGHPIVESWDESDSSYFLLQRRSLFYFSHLEEDDFELKRIAEQFFIKMKLDSTKAIISSSEKYPTAIAEGTTKNGIPIKVKVIINGSYYYLLAAISNNKNSSEKFINSFEIQDFKYLFENEISHDSTIMMTIKSNYILPSAYKYAYNKAYEKKQNKNKTVDESFNQKISNEYFYSENFEKIEVTTKKFHIYESYENIDSLWANEVRNLLQMRPYKYSSMNYEDKTYNFILKSQTKNKENNREVLYVSITDTATSRAFYYKFILNHGVLYKISVIGDSTNNQSEFVKSFFKHAAPFDTIVGRSLFEDKASLFFNAIYSTDSLETENALKSTYRIKFKEKDIDSLKLILTSYKFPTKHLHARKQLIDKLLSIKVFNDMEFVEQLYKSAGDTAMYQIEILNNLAIKGSKQSIATYFKLLDYDAPISGESWNNNLIFSPYKYNLEAKKAKKNAFPALLNYTFIDKYRESIISTLARQVDSNYIPISNYKKNISQLLREAKIVFKEQISYEQTQQSNQNTNYSNSYSYKYKNNDLLVSYATALIPHYKNKAVKEFIDKFAGLKNYTVKNEVYCRMQKRDIEVDTSIWNQLASDPVNRAALYKIMEKMDLLNYFPKQYILQENFAISLLYDKGFNFEEDSLVLIEKRFVNDGKDSGYVYFFKTKSKEQDYWKLNHIGYQPLDTTKISIEKKINGKGDKINKSIPIEEQINEIVNNIILRNRPHADGSEDRQTFYYY